MVTDENKNLILGFLQSSAKAVISDFEKLLPSLNRNQIHKILKTLKLENKIEFVGNKKDGYWRAIN